MEALSEPLKSRAVIQSNTQGTSGTLVLGKNFHPLFSILDQGEIAFWACFLGRAGEVCVQGECVRIAYTENQTSEPRQQGHRLGAQPMNINQEMVDSIRLEVHDHAG